MRKFDHVGLPTSEKQPHELYAAETKVWVTDPAAHPLKPTETLCVVFILKDSTVLEYTENPAFSSDRVRRHQPYNRNKAPYAEGFRAADVWPRSSSRRVLP